MPARANVYLTGLSGSGKSTVGPILASRLGVAFIDTDSEIEQRTGRSIKDIFSHEGEPGFRRYERDAVAAASAVRGAVVALGGGALLSREVRGIVMTSGTLVHLATRVETLVARIGAAIDRPLLAAGVEERLNQLASERTSLYAAASITVQTDGWKPEDVARSIAEELAVAVR